MEIEHWQDETGFIPYQYWIKNYLDDGARMAESMVACLEVMHMKCKFVKDLSLEGLHELRSKSQQIRVYFFLNEDESTACITTAGDKGSQKRDIIYSYNIMKGAKYEYSKKN